MLIIISSFSSDNVDFIVQEPYDLDLHGPIEKLINCDLFEIRDNETDAIISDVSQLDNYAVTLYGNLEAV